VGAKHGKGQGKQDLKRQLNARAKIEHIIQGAEQAGPGREREQECQSRNGQAEHR
jgi:hypothetical protein